MPTKLFFTILGQVLAILRHSRPFLAPALHVPEIYRWNISRATDIFENDISYRYIQQDSTTSETSYLKEIAYGDALVEFTYSGDPGDIEREDAQTGYYTGFPQKMTRYLKSIDSSIGGSKSFRYRLDYRINRMTFNLLLARVTQIGTGGEEMPATEFDYSGEEISEVAFNPPAPDGELRIPLPPK